MSFRSILITAVAENPYRRKLECIRGTGTQYIDTGIVADVNTEIEIRAEATANAPSYLFGSFADIVSKNWSISFGSDGVHSCYYGTRTAEQSFLRGGSWQIGVPQVIKIKSGGRFYQNDGNGDILIADYTDSPFVKEFSAGTVKLLYAYWTCGLFKLYYCKMWQSEALVRDMIPVLDEAGIPGLYDNVTKEMFYNAGSGDFLYESK